MLTVTKMGWMGVRKERSGTYRVRRSCSGAMAALSCTHDHVSSAIKTGGVRQKSPTVPSASARCTMPLASRVTGRKGRGTSEREANGRRRFPKRTTLRCEARLFRIKMPAEVIDVRERYS